MLAAYVNELGPAENIRDGRRPPHGRAGLRGRVVLRP